MSERKLKTVLDQFLGLRDGENQAGARLMQEWKKMRDHGKMPESLKKQGWAAIQASLRAEIENASAEQKTAEIKKPVKILPFRPIRFAYAAAIIAVTLFVWNLYFTKPGLNEAVLAGKTSEVFINGKAASAGARIKPGDVIESDGSYRLVFGKSMALDVQYKSRLKLGQNEQNDYIVDLQDGGVAAVIRPDKKRQNIVFNTPTGAIAVTGTIFYLRVMSQDETYFCICHGGVHLVTKHENRRVEAAHHGGYSIIRQNNAEKIVTDGMKYHQDPLLEEMAAGIGYSFTWK